MKRVLYSIVCAQLYNQFASAVELSASVGSKNPAATAPTKPSTIKTVEMTMKTEKLLDCANA